MKMANEVNAQETPQVSKKELRAAISDLARGLHAFTVGEFVELSSDELAALAAAVKVLDTIVIRM